MLLQRYYKKDFPVMRHTLSTVSNKGFVYLELLVDEVHEKIASFQGEYLSI